jgi:hypothetical protein
VISKIVAYPKTCHQVCHDVVNLGSTAPRGRIRMQKSSESAYPESFGRGTGLSMLHEASDCIINVRNGNSGDWIADYMASALR